jgi:hypothetical protein
MEGKFALSHKPQEAVFTATVGATGGMGETVLDPTTGSIKFFKGHPIYVDSEIIHKFVTEKRPDGWVGEMRVRIAANITLVKKTQRNFSIPGGPQRTFWEVQINKLHDVELLPEEVPQILFFTVLDKLLALEKLEPNEVGRSLGINLTCSPEQGGPSSEVYVGQGEADVLKAELRLPGTQATGQGDLLSLTLNPTLEITPNDVTMRFLSPVSETPLSGEPPYWSRSYRVRGALVTFEFASEPYKVRAVVIDQR